MDVRIVTCTLDELRALVQKAVREALAETPPPPARVYTSAEAAEYLRLSTGALRQHVRNGRIKPDVFGKRGRTAGHRFSQETLDAFLLGGEPQAKPAKPRPRW